MKNNSKEQYTSKLTKIEMESVTRNLIILVRGRHDKGFKNIKEDFNELDSIS